MNINAMIMSAMKAGEKEKAAVYRLIKAKFLEWRTSKEGAVWCAKMISSNPMIKVENLELPEATEYNILNKMYKERIDTAKVYEDAKRFDLALAEQTEAKLINELLPKAATDEDILNCINTYITSNGAYSQKEMGTVIKFVKEKLPTADGKSIATFVKAKIQ